MNARIWQAALLAGLAGVGAGAAAGYRLALRAPPAPMAQVREGGSGLTNPLLECDAPEAPPGTMLVDFQAGLDSLVHRALETRRVGRIGVYFRDLNTGAWYGVNEDEPFRPASLLKVPVVMAAVKQGEGDPGFAEREVAFEGFRQASNLDNFKAENQIAPGGRYRVAELARRAIVYSDNYAAATLALQLDRRVLRDLLVALGLPADLAEDYLRPLSLSVRDYSRFFRILYNATYLKQRGSEQVLRLLSQSTFADGIVAGVPPGTVVAHKFGIKAPGADDPPQLHDCGIVYAPRRPYFLCVMTSGRDYAELGAVIAEVSRYAYGNAVAAP